MALTPVAQDMIIHAAQAAETLRALKGMLDELNQLYDSGGGYKTTITQADLDSVPSLSGLTKAQLDDAMYVLTATVRGDITNGLGNLIVLAVRA